METTFVEVSFSLLFIHAQGTWWVPLFLYRLKIPFYFWSLILTYIQSAEGLTTLLKARALCLGCLLSLVASHKVGACKV